MTVMRGADALVETLNAHDTELVVGFIGHTSHEVADALGASAEIRSFHPVTELGGAAIVFGYNLQRGRSAAVGIWHTVGSLLAVGPIFDADASRVPAVHIGLNVDGVFKDREAFQETPNELFSRVTRFFTKVERPDKIPEALHRAFHAAHGPRRGAAFIDIPFDLTIDHAEMEIPAGFEESRTLRAGDPEDAAAIARALEGAESPILMVGAGAVHAGAGEELLALAESLAIPVTTTINAAGIVPQDHPLSVGPHGIVGWPVANELATEADVVLAVGCRFADWGWAQAYAGEMQGRLFQIDTDANQLGDFYFPEVGIVGDARRVLAQVNEAVALGNPAGHRAYEDHPRFEQLQERRSAWIGQLEENWSSDEFPCSPWRVVHDVQAALGDDDVIVTDVGNNAAWVFQGTIVRKPRRIVAPFGAGVLGSALPLALGAKLAEPDSKVVAVTGDGGFQYSMSEIATAIREDIPVTVVVLNDGFLGASEQFMGHLYGKAQWTKLQSPDFVSLAKAYGADGERVEDAGGLQAAIERGVASDRLYIVDVPVQTSYIHPSTGAGPTVRWEPRTWPGNVINAKMPHRPGEGVPAAR